MLAPHLSRCLLHSRLLPTRTRLPQIRSLRTLPRKIPSYLTLWNPSLHRPIRPRKASTEQVGTQEPNAGDEDSKRKETPSTSSSAAAAKKNAYACRRLRHLLRRTDANAIDDVAIQGPIWRAYTEAKRADKMLCLTLSVRDWQILWDTQSVASEKHPRRALHLEELGRDMSLHKKLLTPAMRANYLDSLFTNGKESEAMQEWEAEHTRVQEPGQRGFDPEHLEVGAKLFARLSEPQRARELMDLLFALCPDWNPSVMVLVLRAHTDSRLGEHHEVANEIYHTFRERMDGQMTIEHYDSCFVGFLEARHLKFAQRVFRDMIKGGHLAVPGNTQGVKELYKRLYMLYRLGDNVSSMTSIALDAIAVLSSEYHGHLYGTWIKTTVILNAPQAAAQILDIMLQRGYKPETFHFNMLIKVLLRSKVKPNVLKAENIGWRMFEVASAQQDVLTADYHEGTKDTNPRLFPAANETTFAMMLQHHADRLQWEHVDYITRQLKETAITPNASLMNVLIDMKTRKGAYAEAWSIYTQLTHRSASVNPTGVNPTGVFPDGATFRHLWKNLRLALGDFATRSDPNLPSPRALIKETIQWWRLCRSRPDASRFRLGLTAADGHAITALILHCFSYMEDHAGSLVALHVMRHHFAIFPTAKAVEILQRQLAWVELRHASQHTRAEAYASRSNTRNREQMVRVYEMVRVRRMERTGMTPGRRAGLSEEQNAEFNLDLLSEFVRVVLKRKYSAVTVEMMVDAAAHAMGCPELEMGDVKAYEAM
jgi:hypothetical protein